MKKALIVLLFFVSACSLFAQYTPALKVETALYAVKGPDSLYLDRYTYPAFDKPKGCIIFMFGGGFVSGDRNAESYQHYFYSLAGLGYTVVSIDYRLGFKGASMDGFANPMQFVQHFRKTIDMAVEDLFDATNYILLREDWHTDASTIIASGSSAGAISVLQAEYYIANKTHHAAKLPQDFNYAGVISFAGAILNLGGDLEWRNAPCPIMLFHGDADANVPFDKVAFSQLGFYGSEYIAGQLKENNYPFYFYKVKNAAHEISGTPMNENMPEIETFIEKIAFGKQPLMIETEVTQIGKPEMKKDFTIMDYVKSNFGM